MKRLAILLTLATVACGLTNTTTPPTPPTTDPITEEFVAPPINTAIPPTETPAPTETTAPVVASSFPNADNYQWMEVVSGLDRPVDIQHAGDGSGRLFIIEQAGRIRIMENDQLLETPFLDISERVDDGANEQGLLGLAFHPNYEQNGYFYVNYARDGGDTVIARFQVTGDPNVADPNTEKQLLNVEQPFPNHNGGVVAFGPDGYLYLGLGDGGAGGDPLGNAQSLDTLLGKILRIDVDKGDPYAIPSDNPFGSEIWAYGLRNPWRMSFDRATGDLWIGDVGQGTWEEIDFYPAGTSGGVNFGWPLLEGTHSYNGNTQTELIMPAAEYSHDQGCSVTGGYVYRGEMPEWQGIYFYGDYCTGFVWGLIQSNGGWQSEVLFETGVRISSFGVDESGEIYFANHGGAIQKLVQK
ncbi:MAG: PQQ-dependent sugar dehydrogenase [Chloroflexi bacterium]|nr:PQQ-dependent sugar dehydrogenase [Chloroflexota bacterium]